MMRLADVFGKGLVGAITGIDLTDLVNQGGLVGAATGMKMPGLSGMGGLNDLLYRHENKDGGLMQLPYYPGTQKGQRLHGIADFDGNYNPTFDIPGGPITSKEMQRMNKMYPLGNINK